MESMDDMSKLKTEALERLHAAKTKEEIEAVRVAYLGRKGAVTLLLRSLGGLSLDERRTKGPKIQKLKSDLETALAAQQNSLAHERPRESIDLSAPGKRTARGHLHPLTLAYDDIRRIFSSMNFSVIEGPEVESEYYNFDALNIPAGHPARDMWDTFWLKQPKGVKTGTKNRMLLRTHTSPMQIRYMEEHTPPLQIIVPGRAFRYEAIDASHEVNFYQLEGLMVGKDISLSNFKFVVEEFFGKFFKKKVEFRYRPSYFPFVEPGLEVDIKLPGGKWLEVMGAGMVHQRVFEYAHYNPEDWQGFAFGVGVDRLAMIRYGIPDIRLFYSGDLRFTKQF